MFVQPLLPHVVVFTVAFKSPRTIKCLDGQREGNHRPVETFAILYAWSDHTVVLDTLLTSQLWGIFNHNEGKYSDLGKFESIPLTCNGTQIEKCNFRIRTVFNFYLSDLITAEGSNGSC